jgi:hypothetical protein
MMMMLSSTVCTSMPFTLISIWLGLSIGNLPWLVWNRQRGSLEIERSVIACLEWAQVCFIDCMIFWYNHMACNLVLIHLG